MINIISEIFTPIGFKKKGNFWIKNDKEITKIVNLQKSHFSNNFYINYGYIINTISLGNNMMHVFNGFGSVNDNMRIKEILNLENDILPKERRRELKELIINLIVLNIQSIQTEEDLLNELKKRRNLNDISLDVKKYFGLP